MIIRSGRPMAVDLTGEIALTVAGPSGPIRQSAEQ
jgi:hypothetical protein